MSYPITREETTYMVGLKMPDPEVKKMPERPAELPSNERQRVWSELLKIKAASVFDLSARTCLHDSRVQAIVDWFAEHGMVTVTPQAGKLSAAVVVNPKAVYDEG